MKVVSDTSPICYLWLIGHIDLLPGLFNHIFIPEALCFELKQNSTFFEGLLLSKRSQTLLETRRE